MYISNYRKTISETDESNMREEIITSLTGPAVAANACKVSRAVDTSSVVSAWIRRALVYFCKRKKARVKSESEAMTRLY